MLIINSDTYTNAYTYLEITVYAQI